MNIAFLPLAALLVWRFFRRGGGLRMLRMMGKPAGDKHSPEHAHQHAGS